MWTEQGELSTAFCTVLLFFYVKGQECDRKVQISPRTEATAEKQFLQHANTKRLDVCLIMMVRECHM